MSDDFELLITLEAQADQSDRLSAVLAAETVACVRLTRPAARAATDDDFKRLIETAHARGVAVIIDEEPMRAARLGADGVFLTGSIEIETSEDTPAGRVQHVSAAKALLPAGALVGIAAGPSRHEAMELGEAGVSFLAFMPEAFDATEGDHSDATGIAWRDQLAWWSELFEIPSVAMGLATPEDAAMAASAGADYIEVVIRPGLSPSAATQHVGAWLEAISEPGVSRS